MKLRVNVDTLFFVGNQRNTKMEKYKVHFLVQRAGNTILENEILKVSSHST